MKTKMSFASKLLISLLALGTSLSVRAGPDLDLTVAGQWSDAPPRPIVGLVIQDSYAYCALESAGMVIVNITDASKPQLVGRYVPEASAYGVWVAGGIAVVTVENSGLHLVDVHDPANPRRLSVYPLFKRSADSQAWPLTDVVVDGQLALVTTREQGLLILEIADPMKPRLIGNYPAAGALAVSGGLAYVANDNRLTDEHGELQVLDLGNPASPRRLGTYVSAEPWTKMFAVAVSGDRAFVGTDVGLESLDISKPAEIKRIGRALFGYPGALNVSVSLSGNYACVSANYADAGSYLQLIDIGNPMKPRTVGTVRDAGRIAADSHYLYVADGAGFRVLNLMNSANPQRRGTFEEPGFQAEDVAVSGKFAYLAGYGDPLIILDISDPSNPRRVGSYDTAAYGVSVAVSGHYAYLGTGDFSGNIHPEHVGLRIIDVSDPAHARQVGSYLGHYGGQGGIGDIIVGDGPVYVAEQQFVPEADRTFGGLRVMDVSDPTNPQPIGFLEIEGGARQFALLGRHAYVPVVGGLEVIDVSRTNAPERVGKFRIDRWYPSGVSVAGTRAYVIGNRWDELTRRDLDQLVILDVSDPANPRRIGGSDSFSGSAVEILEDNVYLAGASGGLDVLNVSDPANPRRVGGSSTFWRAGAMTVTDGKLFVAVQQGFGQGLAIFDPFTPLSLRVSGWREKSAVLSLSGPKGRAIRIQRSTDLKSWQDWQSLTLGNLPLEFLDSEAPSQAHGFYRAATQ